eukprot:gnl/Dysnectes_brevis/5879_a8738_423.p1 GENE.gnl/Dysnectes_brevis/5879_a8738_423~~gnl/Dysnectes_brevis/5879_a8738_423.p1  ORF type:complete len:122 (-),score=36.64 gnl/Dysnectes_brevis/5879_a8738_423:214-579(-)
MLVIPGGMQNAIILGRSEQARQLALEMKKNKAYIAAICAAPAVTLSTWSDVITPGTSMTCYPGLENRFPEHVKYVCDQPVVEDGQFITSRGPGTAMEFAFHLIGKLKGSGVVDEIKKAMLL